MGNKLLNREEKERAGVWRRNTLDFDRFRFADDVRTVARCTLQSLGNVSDPNMEPDVQAAWNAMLDVVRSQRAALVNLIQQDLAAVGTIN